LNGVSDNCGGIPMASLITAQRVLVVGDPLGTLNWVALREHSRSPTEKPASERVGMARTLRSDNAPPSKSAVKCRCTDPSLEIANTTILLPPTN